MSKTVTFIIDNGEVEIKATGFKGGACDVATKAFEELLGGNISKKARTADFYKTEVATVKLGAK